MRTVKRVALLAVVFWAFVIASCLDCPQIQGVYFNVKGMTAREFRQNGAEVRAGEELTIGELIVLQQFNLEYYSKGETTGSLISPTYAKECPQNGERGSKEVLKNIVIQTINKYNDDYLAGDTLNDIVNVQVFGLNVPLNAFLTRDSMRVNYEGFGWSLITAPTQHQSKFRTTVTFTNGEKYVTETEQILLN